MEKILDVKESALPFNGPLARPLIFASSAKLLPGIDEIASIYRYNVELIKVSGE